MSVDDLTFQDLRVISTVDLLFDRSIICEASYRVYGLKAKPATCLTVCSQKRVQTKEILCRNKMEAEGKTSNLGRLITWITHESCIAHMNYYRIPSHRQEFEYISITQSLRTLFMHINMQLRVNRPNRFNQLIHRCSLRLLGQFLNLFQFCLHISLCTLFCLGIKSRMLHISDVPNTVQSVLMAVYLRFKLLELLLLFDAVFLYFLCRFCLCVFYSLRAIYVNDEMGGSVQTRACWTIFCASFSAYG